MDTLVFKDSKKINDYIKTIENISEYQKKLLRAGFPYALEVGEKTFECTRDYFLINKKVNNKWKNPESKKYIKMLNKSFIVSQKTYDLIEQCNCFGDVVIISNFYDVLRPSFDALFDKNKFFKVIFSCDVGMKKPSVEMLKLSGYTEYEKKFYFGDNWNSDILPALSKGFECIYVNNNDKFMNKIYEKGIQSFIEKRNQIYCFKDKYREIFKMYFDNLLNVDEFATSDIYVDQMRVLPRILKNIRYYKNLDEINKIQEILCCYE